MGKVFIENNIGEAINIVNDTIAKDGVINSTYRSKMSAFGAAVINNGLIPALSFYQGQEDGEDVVTMLRKLDSPKSESNLEYIRDLKKKFSDEEKPEEKLEEKLDEKLERTKKILDYSVALKLAMNCFIKENKDKDNE